MDNFFVRMTLSSPLILGSRLSLDGLLAAMEYQRSGDLARAHDGLPLERTLGVWRGSAAIAVTPTGASRFGKISFQQSMRPATLDASIFVPGKRGIPKIDVGRGQYGNTMDWRSSVEASLVYFSGRGDVDAVDALLDGIDFIGAKRAHGFGRVEACRVEAVGADYDHFGLKFSDGSPARPVPMAAWAEIDGDANTDQGLERVCPPYWRGEMQPCAVPSPRILGLIDDDAATLIGA